MSSTLMWLRDDLRLDDNPAVAGAASLGDPLTVVYVLDEASPGLRPLGGAAKWWLHHSLTALSADLAAAGTGGPYKVFTPFWRACLNGTEPRPPLDAPRRLPGPATGASGQPPVSDSL